MAHSYLGASAMKIRMQCPGSYNLSKMVQAPDDSVSSATGTATHWVGEECLTAADGDQLFPVDFTDTTAPNGVFLDADTLIPVTEYVNHVCSTLARLGAKPCDGQAERYIDLSWVDKEMFGTCDFIYFHEASKTVYVWDYKNGYDDVEAVDNPQLAFYALGEYERAERAVCFICQPNAGGIKQTSYLKADLEQWVHTFRSVAAKCRDKKAERCAGSHCKFCPAKAACPENMSWAWATFGRCQDVRLPNPSAQDIADELNAIEAAIQALRARKEIIEFTAFNMAYNSGQNIPGFKLVETQSRRVWKDEAQVIEICEFLGVNCFDKKLLTPAKLDKIIDTQELTDKPIGKPKLVRTSQRGAPIQSKLVEVFSNVKGATPCQK